MIVKPDIIPKLLPINTFSRPGKKLIDIRGIAMHWTGNPNASAMFHAKYFADLAKQNPNDDIPDRYASAHYFVGVEGEIVQLIPDDEMAYHVGAKEYKEPVLNHFNTTYPNNCLIGVELCHTDWSGKFTESTFDKALHLVSYLLEKYDLVTADIVRHYDVTGKICPKWWVENEDNYNLFLGEVSNLLKRSRVYNERIRAV